MASFAAGRPSWRGRSQGEAGCTASTASTSRAAASRECSPRHAASSSDALQGRRQQPINPQGSVCHNRCCRRFACVPRPVRSPPRLRLQTWLCAPPAQHHTQSPCPARQTAAAGAAFGGGGQLQARQQLSSQAGPACFASLRLRVEKLWRRRASAMKGETPRCLAQWHSPGRRCPDACAPCPGRTQTHMAARI